MCGRFTLAVEAAELARDLAVPDVPADYRPRYNIAPTQDALVVGRGPQGDRCAAFRWGLVPPWAEDVSIGNRLINARSKSVARKRAFRDAFAHRRCLVPADGFYEWRPAEPHKQPFYIRRRDRRVFTFAGLWERWHRPDGSTLHSFAILTTRPSALLRPIHDRMPVLIGPDDRATWLDPSTPADHLPPLLRPWDADDLEAFPVSTFVNAPANEGPECVACLS